MKKRYPLIALSCAFSLSQVEGAKKPNILYILADDLGYADLSIHGCKQYQTPNIDSIFNNGVRFTQGYVSNSVCAPSRAGLLTGRMGSQFGFEANFPHKEASKPGSTIGLDPKEKTIADVLKPAGYRSYCIGKWHLGDNVDLFHPNLRGFDDFLGFIGGSRSYWKLEGEKKDEIHSLQHNSTFLEEDDDFYITDYLTDKAINFITKQKKKSPEEPFFMYMSYTAPHAPMHAKESDLARVSHIEKEKRRIYAGMVLSLDDNVGRLLKCLKSLNILENTMVVFMSDNGGPTRHNGSWNGKLRGQKGTLWEGGIRVPYAIQWKGKIPAGQVNDTPVISLDLLPTFAAISGADKLSKVVTDGVDLMPLLTNKVDSISKRNFFWRRGKMTQVAMRNEKYKYYYNRRTDHEFLFDIKDGNEKGSANLADKLPEVVSEMRKAYKRFEKNVQEPAWKSGWKPKKSKKKSKKKQH